MRRKLARGNEVIELAISLDVSTGTLMLAFAVGRVANSRAYASSDLSMSATLWCKLLQGTLAFLDCSIDAKEGTLESAVTGKSTPEQTFFVLLLEALARQVRISRVSWSRR